MAQIDHVVVLMLENRSFDQVLGWYGQKRPEIDGLKGDEKNAVRKSIANLVYRVDAEADPLRAPAFDPPHEFEDVSEQIFGTAHPSPGQEASMCGFAGRALRESLEHAAIVMSGFAPGSLPAIHELAQEFAVCQRWFSSVPGPTWPNRFFAHCGTAGGFLDGAVRAYGMPSVFEGLSALKKSWKVYYHDIPQTLALSEQLKRLQFGRYGKFPEFGNDAARGKLPNYSFIEPNYFSVGGVENANDQHPPANMIGGDQLVRSVYESLRNSAHWERSVLLVVWDEHGGFFDHVPPPRATAPERTPGQHGFCFDRLGVRVPALVISPWVDKGRVDNTQYDHASIPATLRHLFGIHALTARDEAAASFDMLLDRKQPRDAPRTLQAFTAPVQPVAAALAAPAALPPAPTGLQKSLLALAEQLTLPPVGAAASEQLPFQERVERNAARVDALLEPESVATAADAATPAPFARNIYPDRADLRDRIYQPSIRTVPKARHVPHVDLKPRDQKGTQGCSGHALAALIDYLLLRSGWQSNLGPVSAGMLYSMARRYDEFSGEDDVGSSLRGALKGWFRHGACADALWDESFGSDHVPPGHTDPKKDWWQDAITRPLGGYYRVEKNDLSDLHCALNELGAVYASAYTHAGWLNPITVDDADGQSLREIGAPDQAGRTGGHAFLIVGYDEEGFHVLSSWGAKWGENGIARLRYEDWLQNGMDAWVLQLGVFTRERLRASKESSLAFATATTVGAPRIEVAHDPVVRDHQLGAFIVNSENLGRLSTRGRFRTKMDDLTFLLRHHLAEFRSRHELLHGEKTNVAIYAHGGLVDEDAASDAAARWVPRLYAAGVFPIFLMWETGLNNIFSNFVEDAARRLTQETGRVGSAQDLFDAQLERVLAPVGEAVWSKMKQNARALSADRLGALRVLFDLGFGLGALRPANTRIHLIGHSAGSIVHAHLLSWLVSQGFEVATLTNMAPAIRVDLFDELVLPRLGKGLKRYTQLSLKDLVEQSDPTVPIYTKSLLYLVSRSFEGRGEVPILGMEKHAKKLLAQAGVELLIAPDKSSNARTHGGFDDDALTIETVLKGLTSA